MEAKSTDDHFGLEPYEIEGYDWEMVNGEEIEEETILPGLVEEVHEVVEQAGYSLSNEAKFYVTMMVEDGGIDWNPQFTTLRSDCNDAMRERVTTVQIYDEEKYWTLVPEDGGDEL